MQESTIIVNGLLYISSERAAKLTGYTTDYVGQLARAGKIDARLIGRTWFVRQEAVCKHRIKKSQLAEKTQNSPYVSKQGHSERQIRLLTELISRTELIHLEGITYEPDLDAPLLPPLSKPTQKQKEYAPKIREIPVAVSVLEVSKEIHPIPSPLSVNDILEKGNESQKKEDAIYTKETLSRQTRARMSVSSRFMLMVPGTVAVVVAFVASFGFASMYTYSSGEGVVEASVVRAPLHIDL